MAKITFTDAVVKDSQLKQYEPAEKEFNDFVDAIKAFKLEIEEDSRKVYSKNQEKVREAFYEVIISRLLDFSFYNKTNYVGKPKNGDIDLVILDEKSSKSKVKVIFEVKSIDNKTEFPKSDGNGGFDINCKALQETVLYYLRESVSNRNKGIRRIVVTNAIEWFIFDAKDFERLFVTGNRQLVKDFENFVNNQLAITTTDKFYENIAQPAIDNVKNQLDYVYFSVGSLDASCSTPGKLKKLIDVFKILSPYYLLKKQFPTDSNALNNEFYKELLHIIGLYETDKDENGKKKNKKTIERLPPSERESGSLLENAILQLSYKSSSNLFERAIQLVIVWINRILFLKLLEAQLIKWHNGDQNYKFLTPKNLPEYDNLKELFFGVIARRPADRQLSPEDMVKYKDIPYLNSSLFEPTEELSIAELKDNIELPLYKGSVLHSQPQNALEYLLLFLDAYDFGADKSTNGLRKQNKTIINASVLGRIFEKINGYKDGSFFTPGTITQYMCEEAIRRAVVQKFNEEKKWNCQTFDELFNKDLDIAEANKIINSIHICDPAVGSGHFLVSALNELIAIKSELGILCLADNPSRRLKNAISIDNDELMVYDENGDLFIYNPVNKHDTANHSVQKTLFEEKRIIIENCLFGVDINPNSVNICRLRLWIELLKNAYYKSDGTLETLPNIDINIKCGNSLVSRYPVSIGTAVSNITTLSKEIKEYKAKVKKYKQENNKIDKQNVEEEIRKIKAKIVPSVQLNLELDDSDATRNRLAIENNIYHNSMEWMIEFPEVLDDEGRFQGFDVVIGNPPYGVFNKKQNQKVSLTTDGQSIKLLRERFPEADERMINAAKVFYALGFRLLSQNGFLNMIIPFGVLSDTSSVKLRKCIFEQHSFIKIDAFPERDSTSRRIFNDAKISTAILLSSNKKQNCDVRIGVSFEKKIPVVHFLFSPSNISVFSPKMLQIPLCDNNTFNLLINLRNRTKFLKIGDVAPCLTGELDMTLGKGFLTDDDTKPMLVKGAQIDRYVFKTKNEEISQGKIEYVDTYAFFKKCSHEKQDQIRYERIVMQGLSGINERQRLKAVLVPANLILANSANCLKYQTEYPIKVLLSFLNSKLLNFIFKATSSSSNVNGYEVDALPLPKLTPYDAENKEKIIDLVDQIITAKQNDQNANTTAWEQQIDLLVYHLYGLTYDEVLIVDPETAITKEEYEA